MKFCNTYIARRFPRSGALLCLLFVFPFEAAFLPKPLVIEVPLLIQAEPSPLLDTRVELLAALDILAPRLSELDRVLLADIVATAAYNHGVDPFLVLAVVKVESEFNDVAKSNRGAVGFMQLRGPTAFEWSGKIGKPMHALGLYDWETNIELGAAYLRFLRDRMGSWPMALAGYNWGPTTVYRGIRDAGGRLPLHMRAYEKRISHAYERVARSAGNRPRAALSFGKMDTRGAI